MNQFNQSVASLHDVSEELVIEYLCLYPEFFKKHEDLLERLELPHQCGTAHSLIERQVEQLRQKNNRLECEKSAAITKEIINNKNLQSMSALTLELLGAPCVIQLCNSLEAYIKKNLKINNMMLALTNNTQNSFTQPSTIKSLQNKLIQVSHFGFTEEEYLHFMQSSAAEIKSVLSLPLKEKNSTIGVLCFGGEHLQQFELGGNKKSLVYLAKIFGIRLSQLVTFD